MLNCLQISYCRRLRSVIGFGSLALLGVCLIHFSIWKNYPSCYPFPSLAWCEWRLLTLVMHISKCTLLSTWFRWICCCSIIPLHTTLSCHLNLSGLFFLWEGFYLIHKLETCREKYLVILEKARVTYIVLRLEYLSCVLHFDIVQWIIVKPLKCRSWFFKRPVHFTQVLYLCMVFYRT